MGDEPSSTVPYVVGALFTIREEAPPSSGDADCGGEPQEPEATQPTSPTERSGSATYQLKITDSILTGEVRDSQIVLGQISPATSLSGSKQVVAKIWDPLYRRDLGDETTGSVAELALRDYSNEVSAYERIKESLKEPQHAALPWECTPQYYGSWSLQCPEASIPYAGPSTRRTRRGNEEAPSFRTVYLVLLEHIQGCSLRSLATFRRGSNYWARESCAEDYRIYVWARILEIQSWLDHIGVDHRDVATRNIMVDPAPASPIWLEDNSNIPESDLIRLQPNRLPRVVFIDFDLSAVGPRSQDPRPQSPVVKRWSGKYDPIMYWLPMWWTANLPVRREWLLREFEKNAYFGELPPDKGPEHVYVFSKRDESLMKSFGFWPPQGR